MYIYIYMAHLIYLIHRICLIYLVYRIHEIHTIYLILYHHRLSLFILPWPILSCPILHPMLAYLPVSYPILAYLILRVYRPIKPISIYIYIYVPGFLGPTPPPMVMLSQEGSKVWPDLLSEWGGENASTVWPQSPPAPCGMDGVGVYRR